MTVDFTRFADRAAERILNFSQCQFHDLVTRLIDERFDELTTSSI